MLLFIKMMTLTIDNLHQTYFLFHQFINFAQYSWTNLGCGRTFQPKTKPTINPIKNHIQISPFGEPGWI